MPTTNAQFWEMVATWFAAFVAIGSLIANEVRNHDGFWRGRVSRAAADAEIEGGQKVKVTMLETTLNRLAAALEADTAQRITHEKECAERWGAAGAQTSALAAAIEAQAGRHDKAIELLGGRVDNLSAQLARLIPADMFAVISRPPRAPAGDQGSSSGA